LRNRRNEIFVFNPRFYDVAVCRLPSTLAAPRKPHVVALGGHASALQRAGDPAGALAGEDSLKIRALLLDGAQKEWTTGDATTLPIAASWCGALCG